ncbi:MAG: hypothetical protein JSU68_10655 [Phycisphaerales bacterium]|nr:MAG: hypothetical protein JSU68_10655 [Phycisphaerales bacterium]
MHAKTIVIVAGTLLLAPILIGCEAPPPPRESMSLIRLPGISEAQAFEATCQVMREFDFRLEAVNADAGYVRSFPQERTVRGGTGRISDPLVQSPHQVRLISEAYIRQAPDGAEIRLAVSRERRDTARYRAFPRDREQADNPQDTPIDMEAGSSPRQYETWTPIGRDRDLENGLRQALEERLLDTRS